LPPKAKRATPAPLASLPTGAAKSPAQRFDRIDALRGVAMVWMTIFHFCFDLQHFGYWAQDFRGDPFWTWQRTAIVSLFLFCAGLSQAVAFAQGLRWSRFWQRWRLVAGCAVLVSIGSYLMFPRSFIYFGVLHGLAVMLIVARLTAGWGRALWWFGALAIGSKFAAAYAIGLSDHLLFFNAKYLNWLGWISQKPFTEDYVPVFPWLGVMWWGMACGQWLLRTRVDWLRAPLPQVMRPLALLGRWSLSYYMLHQPVLMGLLLAFGWFVGHR